MYALSLFAGIGGFDRGLERAGHTVVGQVELDRFCRRVLERRWPRTPRGRDVRSWSGGEADLLVGGFPCQDVSVAGHRAGLGGARTGLFWEIVRIAQALRPRWGLLENVPGLVSSGAGRDLWAVLGGLRQCWPAVGWRVLDSQHFGVPQRRRRLFLVGGPDEAGVAAVLALTPGRPGDPAPGDPPGDDDAQGGALARPLTASPRTHRFDADTETFVVADPVSAHEGKTYSHEGRNNFRLRNVVAGVRRLTPVECERLQGFPDGWTCLCTALEAYARDPDAAALACRCPDAPRYRALGNAVTVPVIAWLGRRLAAVEATRG
jgi:DNA (cytosine-5)-methyltransferase 1